MSEAQPGALSRRTFRRGRFAVVAVVLGLLASFVPTPSHAAVGMTVDCSLVRIELYRLSSGGWRLETPTPGICAVVDRDPVGLPWDLARLGGAYFDANGGVTAVCSGSTLVGVNGVVTYTVEETGGNIIDTYPGLNFSLTADPVAGTTVMLMSGATAARGTGAFTMDPDSRCVSAPSSGKRLAGTWTLGEYVFEDPLAN
ncbi:MAG TPA: hypothetical protein VM618_04960 [Acidimicrobiia bacterium]|nr:hypothetical protein [Acidimicrobiia bacterium]